MIAAVRFAILFLRSTVRVPVVFGALVAAALRSVPIWVEKGLLTDAVFDVVPNVPLQVRWQLHLLVLLSSLFSSVCGLGDHDLLLKTLPLQMMREGDHADFV